MPFISILHHAESAEFIAQGRFLEDFGKQPGIVLSDIDPVYLNALFPRLGCRRADGLDNTATSSVEFGATGQLRL